MIIPLNNCIIRFRENTARKPWNKQPICSSYCFLTCALRTSDWHYVIDDSGRGAFNILAHQVMNYPKLWRHFAICLTTMEDYGADEQANPGSQLTNRYGE